MNNLKDTYNQIAEDWHKDHINDDWWIEGTNKVASMLKKGATILDVGCGSGLKSKYLANKGFDVNGVDFSEKMIEIAKRHVPEAHFDVMNVHEFDTFNKKFDCVFAQAVILHIPKEKVTEVLQKFKNKLKRGGLLYIAVKEVKDGQPPEEIRKESDYGYDYERFFSYYSLDELRQHFDDLGLKIVWEGITTSGKTNWLQIIGRRSIL